MDFALINCYVIVLILNDDKKTSPLLSYKIGDVIAIQCLFYALIIYFITIVALFLEKGKNCLALLAYLVDLIEELHNVRFHFDKEITHKPFR